VKNEKTTPFMVSFPLIWIALAKHQNALGESNEKRLTYSFLSKKDIFYTAYFF